MDQSLLHGVATPPPDRVELTAGPWTLWFEDGDLRRLRLGVREVVRRIYAAVRDHEWATIPCAVGDLSLERSANGFRIGYAALHVQGGIRYHRRMTISGSADGTIRVAMRGEALSDFRRNRIGICVLLPTPELCGHPLRIVHADGTRSETVLPALVQPDQPVFAISAIDLPLPAGGDLTLRFTGEVFEMEDQRNWGDSSFKIYSTPQERPKPVAVASGEVHEQAVVLTIAGFTPPAAELAQPPRIRFAGHAVRLPRVVPTARGGIPGEVARERLRALRLAALRHDCDPAVTGWKEALHAAAIEARYLSLTLEITLLLGDPARELPVVVAGLAGLQAPVSRWWMLPRDCSTTPRDWPAALRQALDKPDALVGGGNHGNFTELNRNRPVLAAFTHACIGYTPQVHAVDDTSILENLLAIPDQVASARALLGGAVLTIAPVTLRARPGGVAPLPFADLSDPRHASLLGAAWTVAALSQWTTAGVESVGLFATRGACGLLRDGADQVPDGWPATAGGVHAAWHVLVDFAEFTGGSALPLTVDDPLAVAALGIQRGRSPRLLVANLTPAPLTVRLPTGSWWLRRLDLDTLPQALAEPETWRRTNHGHVEDVLELGPYAVARLDG